MLKHTSGENKAVRIKISYSKNGDDDDDDDDDDDSVGDDSIDEDAENNGDDEPVKMLVFFCLMISIIALHCNSSSSMSLMGEL
jgi:hypothetical protein